MREMEARGTIEGMRQEREKEKGRDKSSVIISVSRDIRNLIL